MIRFRVRGASTSTIGSGAATTSTSTSHFMTRATAGAAAAAAAVPPLSAALMMGGGGSIGGIATAAALTEQRRYSFKYAKKAQMDEMRQPSYIHDKRHGIFSNEHNIGKSRRGLPFITPTYTKHMALWETDTDASTNRFFRSYVFGQRELHQLLGRTHGFEADGTAGHQSDSAYELATDQRYKGVSRPAITNLHYEPEWNYTLHRHGAQGSQLTNPRSPLTEEVLGAELLAVRDVKSVEHCRAWFDRLQFLIKLHYDAVGDIGEFKSRHTQHVHEFFVMFHDALSSFDFQDGYLFDQFKQVRPAELEDVFGIFLEMESNYIHADYCPRCSLPTATTRYCGEGDTNTPFRKHRGRWAEHQSWGKEWYGVVVRRAEALWYRSTEDPYFGTEEHTQRQVSGLLAVYVKAKQRAKALDFVSAIRGSKEFLLGRVVITAEMQHALDHLLDTTPHQHLLTNSFAVQNKAAVYTGAERGNSSPVPHSPLQLRIDLEMSKFRREQKEEGVVRVPPALWSLDTSDIVPYKLDPVTKRVTNWREVKAGIERSFVATGLQRAAYTSEEWREMVYLRDSMAGRGQRRAELEAQRRTEEAKARQAGAVFVVFPDADWYRVFDTSAGALEAFGVTGGSGAVFTAKAKVYPNPAEVPYKDAGGSGADMRIDTTDEACVLYGGYRSGDVLRVTPPANKEKEKGRGKAPALASGEAVVVGVNKAGAESEWSLVVMPRTAGGHVIELGKDCIDIKDRYESVVATGLTAAVSVLDGERRVTEEFLGQVVGVRNHQLYVQWRLLKGGGSGALDRSVAVCLGARDLFTSRYTCRELGPVAEPLVEPSSWRTPFRNEFAEERLKELTRAPFTRERYASLVKGKYTPKVKRFGYTQHTTQDDFQTKEYTDRVLARQFFNDPQAFEVLPERRERSVKFAGKWAYQRTHGLPTVDRNELENGWAEREAVSDEELAVMEQALRDISGRRPGNFVKSPTEMQALRLNESWWEPLEFGWEEHNKQQRAFLDGTEQRIIENARLPFGGKVPPFGTSYGIGERIRDIAADYAKGFGLGPHGHSPGHDTAHFNTLGAEDARVRTLGLSTPLVRLFEVKLGNADASAWALQQCGRDGANVKQLLLSLHEWRERGRAPSLLLTTVLAKYLRAEVDAFNQGLPEGVPRLSVEADDPYALATSNINNASPSASPSAMVSSNIWASVDGGKYGYEHVRMSDRGDSGEAYILGLIQRADLGAAAAGFTDVAYTAFLQQDVVARFQIELARIVGRGIDATFTAQRSLDAAKGNQRGGGTLVQFVRVSELSRLLLRLQVSAENVSVVERGLANCPEHHRLSGSDGSVDLVVPTALIFSWGGPIADSSSGAPPPASSSSQVNPRHGGGGNSNSDAVSRAMSGAAGGSGGGASGKADLMAFQVLEELALCNDGLATDVRYAIRENTRNPVLRQEFFNAFLPVFGHSHALVAQRYTEYCEGKYVPNIVAAFEAFAAFLANVAAGRAIPSVVPYFSTRDSNSNSTEFTQLNLLPPSVGPFRFDNTKCEVIETANLFKRYGIVAGPTRVLPTRFIAANSKSLSYFTLRTGDTVRVSAGADQGLRQELERSPHWPTTAAHSQLRHIIASPAALTATFNRFFQRATPMLNFYADIISEYNVTAQSLSHAAGNANRGLSRQLDSELAPSMELEFRRNAERYWRGVLDGRHNEDAGGGGGGQGGRQPYQQQQHGSRDDGSRGGGDLQQQQLKGSAGLARALGTSPTPKTSSGSGGAAAPAAASSSDRLGAMLGVVSRGGTARRRTPGSGSSSSKGPTPATPTPSSGGK